MRKLDQPIVLEWIGMGGRDVVFLTLTYYDPHGDCYYSENGMSATGEYLAAVRRGEFSWMRVAS